jgi:hypothetical protein
MNLNVVFFKNAQGVVVSVLLYKIMVQIVLFVKEGENVGYLNPVGLCLFGDELVQKNFIEIEQKQFFNPTK